MRLKTKFSIKKAISLSFLLIVNIVILTHALIPHHHHHGIPVIPVAAQHDNSHPDDPDNSEVVYVRLNNEKQLIQSLDFNYFPSFFTLFAGFTVENITADSGRPFKQKPYLLSYNTACIAQLHGLRAPPF
jgi:hypothetical protein